MRQVGAPPDRRGQPPGLYGHHPGVPGGWLVLTVLGMVFETGLLPMPVLVVVWGTLQMSYTLACIRMSKRGGAQHGVF